MKYTIEAKPTVYGGTKYRSRLEARWAAFFDLLGWKYQYEPYDLKGWTPDFVIYFKNGDELLCEVKPTFDHAKERSEYFRKHIKPHIGKEIVLLVSQFKGGNFKDESGVWWLDSDKKGRHDWKNMSWWVGDCNKYALSDGDKQYWPTNNNYLERITCLDSDDSDFVSLWVQAGELTTFHYA